ncbi:MAG: hypothetical protein ABSB19_17190 [Methylomonas sp.]|jgi:hypothetical protein
MAEFNPDDIETPNRDVVVLQTIQPHHALVKTNRVLLTLVFILMTLVFVMGLILLPRHPMLEQIGRQRAANADVAQNSAISAEITTLKSQMFSLVSGSVESKLKSLEDNLRRGNIAASMDALQDLKGDVKLLTALPQDSAVRAEQTAVEQTVIKELSELKSLIYLTFVSCGLMIAALAGVWLRRRHRLTHQHKPAFLSREK